MTWHLLGLLKGDVGLAWQPLITEGLVLGVENVRGGSVIQLRQPYLAP